MRRSLLAVLEKLSERPLNSSGGKGKILRIFPFTINVLFLTGYESDTNRLQGRCIGESATLRLWVRG